MSLSSRAPLRDATNNKSSSAFNRDAAKSHLLKSLTSSTTTAKATSHKLMETLTNMSKASATADGKAKLGGARRVAVPNTASAQVVPLAPSTEPASWQVEKDSLLAQVSSLQAQLLTLQSPSASAWSAEKVELENACVATQEALEAQRAQTEALKQQVEAMSLQLAAQAIELTAAQDKIAQLQREKDAYERAANADTDVSGRSANSVQPSTMDDGGEDDTVEFPTLAKTATKADEAAGPEMPASPVVVLNVSSRSPLANASTASPAPLPSAFAPFPSLDDELPTATTAASAAVAVVDPTTDDFAPITIEEMERSLGAHDPFALLEEEHPHRRATDEANESAGSINLSMSASREMLMSPHNRSGVQSSHLLLLPSAFNSPKAHGAAVDMPSPIASHSPAADSSPNVVASSSSLPSSSSSSSLATLSASARKIQAHFRGYMERTYLPQEQALAKLPLTSPSTPAAKRRKGESGAAAGVSPVKLAHGAAFGIEEEEDQQEDDMDQSTAKASARKPCLDDLDVDEPTEVSQMDESMEDASPTAAAAAASAAAPDSMFSSTTSSSATRPTAAAQLPVGQPIAPADAKRFSSELRSLRPTLGSLDACWTLRSKAMNRAEQLVRERGLNGFSAWTPGWKDELAGFQRCMGMQLSDLRSSILREACRLLLALAEGAPREFEDQLMFYLPLLWKSLYVTIKIISTTADETCGELVERVATAKSIPLLLSGLQDTHAVVREKVGTYLARVLAQATASELEVALPAITVGLKAGLGDNDAKARASWRAVFGALRGLFPAQMHAVLEGLPTTVQKAIEADRKAAAAKPSAKALAGKRKK